MRSRMIIAAFVVLVAVAACRKHESSTSYNAPSSSPSVTAVNQQMTPEQLGELGAQIKKEPARAHELLAQHGLTEKSFETAIRKITEDPDASKRYAAAYKRAS